MITILFTCKECNLINQECKVRSRAGEENIVEWMEHTVIPAIALKHSIMSMFCQAKEITNLKIPIDNNDPNGWIGKQTNIIPPK